jgi:hypothetical protein
MTGTAETHDWRLRLLAGGAVLAPLYLAPLALRYWIHSPAVPLAATLLGALGAGFLANSRWVSAVALTLAGAADLALWRTPLAGLAAPLLAAWYAQRLVRNLGE